MSSFLIYYITCHNNSIYIKFVLTGIQYTTSGNGCIKNYIRMRWTRDWVKFIQVSTRTTYTTSIRLLIQIQKKNTESRKSVTSKISNEYLISFIKP